MYQKFARVGYGKVLPEQMDIFGPLLLYYACPPMLAVLMMNVITAMSRGYARIVAGPTWSIPLVIFNVFCLGTGGNKTAICRMFTKVSKCFCTSVYLSTYVCVWTDDGKGHKTDS